MGRMGGVSTLKHCFYSLIFARNVPYRYLNNLETRSEILIFHDFRDFSIIFASSAGISGISVVGRIFVDGGRQDFCTLKWTVLGAQEELDGPPQHATV